MLLLASGASEIAPSQDDLDDAVLRVCDDLCAQLQADAEGVTKRIAITVTGAPSEDDAVVAARVIARDSLVKTALFGSDPNWGRVLAAVGMAPFTHRARADHGVVQRLPGLRRRRRRARRTRRRPVGAGHRGHRRPQRSATAQATIRTTDLSHAYVEENSAYSS